VVPVGCAVGLFEPHRCLGQGLRHVAGLGVGLGEAGDREGGIEHPPEVGNGWLRRILCLDQARRMQRLFERLSNDERYGLPLVLDAVLLQRHV
jgi:hypothetical protein